MGRTGAATLWTALFWGGEQVRMTQKMGFCGTALTLFLLKTKNSLVHKMLLNPH